MRAKQYFIGALMSNYFSTSSNVDKNQGFTLIELIVAIAIVAILSGIALPSLNDFMVKMRVDNEISEMQRLLLTARNMAINTGKNTTICPLSGTSCTTDWHKEISVFTNDSNDVATNDTFDGADELVKIKEAIKSNDKLQFVNGNVLFDSVIYAPSGRLISPTLNSIFRYCPKDNADASRGIDLSISGRSYTSSDIDGDGKDEDRDGNEFICSVTSP